MINDIEITAGIGDMVEYGKAILNPDGSEKVPAQRGVIEYVFGNGNVNVKTHSGQPRLRLRAGEYTIISKAD